MEEHFRVLGGLQFTAEMEDYLDQISRNERENLDYLKKFYFGDESVAENAASGWVGLKPLLEQKVAEIDPRVACSYPLEGELPDTAPRVCVRVGRYGPYVEQGIAGPVFRKSCARRTHVACRVGSIGKTRTGRSANRHSPRDP